MLSGLLPQREQRRDRVAVAGPMDHGPLVWRNASAGRSTRFLRQSKSAAPWRAITGHVKDGKVHGVGVCVYTDGSRYQGDWKAGLK